jgi:LPS-assembly protein
VVDEHGCDKQPSWRVTARRVFYDAAAQTVRFEGAYLELFGQRVLPLPGLSIRSDGGSTRASWSPTSASPRPTASRSSAAISGTSPTTATCCCPATSTAAPRRWSRPSIRALTQRGAYQVTGFLTYSTRLPLNATFPTAEKDIRGYVFANGRFQLDSNWSVTGSARYATDRTFLRRYDISRDDRLRSTVDVERNRR